MNYNDVQENQDNEKSKYLADFREVAKNHKSYSNQQVIDLVAKTLSASNAPLVKIKALVSSNPAMEKIAEYAGKFLDEPEKFSKALNSALTVLDNDRLQDAGGLSVVFEGSVAGDDNNVLSIKVKKHYKARVR